MSFEYIVGSVRGTNEPIKCKYCDKSFSKSSWLLVEVIYQTCIENLIQACFKCHMGPVHEGNKPFNCEFSSKPGQFSS